MRLYEHLIAWFEENKRDLPWRHSKDPYTVWVSEIILQQTRVIQGLDYYIRFTARFPNVESLAKAEEQEVLAVWQGLGYYSRARNMHQAARQIMKDFGGVFPQNYADLRKLKGVGDYTAAAVASFAFKEAQAVVDGNVLRVIARTRGIFDPIDMPSTQKQIRNYLESIIDKERPDEGNQALMEFGALHCKPKQALCENCILAKDCVAYQRGVVDQLPVKRKKAPLQERYLNYYFVGDAKGLFLRQRKAKDIWQGLWELPGVSYGKAHSDKETIQCLSHRRLHIHFHYCEKISAKEYKELQKECIFVAADSIGQYAMPKAIKEYVQNFYKKK